MDGSHNSFCMRQTKADVAYALSRSSGTDCAKLRVNTLQDLRFGTKESRQGLALSDSMSV